MNQCGCYYFVISDLGVDCHCRNGVNRCGCHCVISDIGVRCHCRNGVNRCGCYFVISDIGVDVIAGMV